MSSTCFPFSSVFRPFCLCWEPEMSEFRSYFSPFQFPEEKESESLSKFYLQHLLSFDEFFYFREFSVDFQVVSKRASFSGSKVLKQMSLKCRKKIELEREGQMLANIWATIFLRSRFFFSIWQKGSTKFIARHVKGGQKGYFENIFKDYNSRIGTEVGSIVFDFSRIS